MADVPVSVDSIWQAWVSNGEWRKLFVAELTREVSKNGSLESFNDLLAALAHKFTVSDGVSLYQQIQRSKRPDCEWRGEFLRIFPMLSDQDLPPPIISEAQADAIVNELRANDEEPDHEGPIPF